jgi:ribosomal protein L40E
MRQLDAGSIYRDEIEKEVERRLAAASSADVGRVPQADVAGARGPAGEACATCNTRNDPDARFCKACGAKLAGLRA